jgi:hypothetical protein
LYGKQLEDWDQNEKMQKQNTTLHVNRSETKLLKIHIIEYSSVYDVCSTYKALSLLPSTTGGEESHYL